MRKLLIVLPLLYVTLTISGCAKSSIEVINRDINSYSGIERELNEKMKLLNERMILAIDEAKSTKDFTAYEQKYKDILIEFNNLLKVSKDMTSFLTSKEMKKYHNYTIKIIQNQIGLATAQMYQFRNNGEHGGHNAKYTQIKYNTKIRKLKKEQQEIIKRMVLDSHS